MKIGTHIESRPINFVGVVALFFFILFAEMVLGGIFYSQAIKYYGANLHKASVIINGGLLATKILILMSLLRLVFYRKTEATQTSSEEGVTEIAGLEEQAAQRAFNWLGVIKGSLWIGLVVLLYRLAFDSLISSLLMGWFGISGDLDWSMYLILGAPILGYSYIFVTAPIFEEIIYRGIFYDGLRKKGHSILGASLFSALLFAVMHLNVVQGVNAFVLGLLTAYIYEKTQNLIAPIFFHILNNVYVTFCSAAIANLQWLSLPLRLLIMGVSIVSLGLILRFWHKEKATQI